MKVDSSFTPLVVVVTGVDSAVAETTNRSSGILLSSITGLSKLRQCDIVEKSDGDSSKIPQNSPPLIDGGASSLLRPRIVCHFRSDRWQMMQTMVDTMIHDNILNIFIYPLQIRAAASPLVERDIYHLHTDMCLITSCVLNFDGEWNRNGMESEFCSRSWLLVRYVDEVVATQPCYLCDFRRATALGRTEGGPQ